MPIGTPATIGAQLQQDVEIWLAESTEYRSRLDLQHRRFLRSTEQLDNADRGWASAVRAVLIAATGDYDATMEVLADLKRRDPPRFEATAATTLIMLARYSESLVHYRVIIDPEFGETHFLHQGAPNGGFETYVRAIDKAKTMFPDLGTFEREDEARRVVSILNQNGETEDHVVAALDVAGEVLRDHGMFQAWKHPMIRPVESPRDGQHPYFGYEIFLKVTDEEALDLTVEYVERLAHSSVVIPSSMVFSFAAYHAE